MDDPRCCGAGVCIINAAGHCWCGQQWDGDKMCSEPPDNGAGKQPVESAQVYGKSDSKTD